MKTIAILFACLILACHPGWGQSTVQTPGKTSKAEKAFPVKNFLKKLKIPAELLACGKRRALIAIQFKVNAHGEVVKAETIGNLEDSTKRYFSDLFLGTRGRWTSYQGKPVTNKWLVLPIRFIIDSDYLRRDSCEEDENEFSFLEASIVKVFDLITSNPDYIILDLCTSYRYSGSDHH